MEQLKQLYHRLTIAQRLSILGAAVLVVFGLWSLAHWNRERDFKPLYTGLAADDAGAVVAKLKEGGIDYRVGSEGAALLVPSAKVDELRLQMAAAGLPKTGRIGYELFDKVNFGATEFAEQVNLRRALEGELERSLSAVSAIETARVHLTFGKDSVFLESRQPAKASVMVKVRRGATLAQPNVTAIQHLAASAVEGLAPEAVSVLDMNGNLLSKPRKDDPDGMAASDSALDYRRKIERDLLTKINTTLEPLVGADKFRAAVSVDCDFSSGEQSEEAFDPSRSVMTSSQKTEDSSSTAAAMGVPGTASALPRAAARPGGGGTGVVRRTENITYQTSRTVKRLRLPQGGIRRVSTALLLDHQVRWEGSGAKAKRIVEAWPAEKLKTVHDLVAGVVGFTADRGDQLIVETLPFDSTVHYEPPAASAPVNAPATNLPAWLPSSLRDKTVLVVLGIAVALVAVLLAGFAALLLRRKRAPAVEQAAALPASKTAETEARVEAKRIEDVLVANAAEKERYISETVEHLKLAAPATKKTEALTRHIGDETKKAPEAMAQLVRAWLNEAQR